MGKASLQAAGHSQSPARVPQKGHDLLSVDSTSKDLSTLLGPDFVCAEFVLQMLLWICYQQMALIWLFSSAWDTSRSPSRPRMESYVESIGTMNSHSTNSLCQVFCNLCPLHAKWHWELLFFQGQASNIRQPLGYVNRVFTNFPDLILANI